ncbi:cyclic nucleotide-binding domain-containing protein 2-like [Wyeomyia smithii]|uniref:cyclic nucleotide-binding domain-containing protein 2-like n=1 Tax=Wyeomyia smithii TaxID=174621 RepID=UPI002467C164|nr:cyclic nucleotide-binding domain-containing protein 2-like [Wyeomyia smithii]
MASKKQAEEEKLRRRRLARYRFKSLIRLVICNNYWLSEIDDQEIGENARRNIAVIVRRKGRKGLLTLLEKAILNQPSEERTAEKRDKLAEVFRRLECLSRFPPEIREQLAKCAGYRYYNAGRTVLREGHEAHAMYFVLDGEITVSRLTWNPVYKRYDDIAYGVRVPGEMFGEISFLYGCPRTMTCATATDCELLCVSRDDFVRLLEPTLRLQWSRMQEAIQRFHYFDHWNEDQIRECCILAKVNHFKPHERITATETSTQFEYAYFVLSGQCMILQCLKVKKKMRGKRECYRLQPLECDEKELRIAERLMKRRDSDVIRSIMSPQLRASLDATPVSSKEDEPTPLPEETLEHHFMDVGSYSCGSVFGLGEQMEDRSIVARNHVQCMMIPRYWLFMKHQNTGNVWQRVKMHLDMAIPSREQLFQQFLVDLNWLVYRKKVVNGFIRLRGRQNHTQLIDVPLMCRVEHARGPN